MEKKSLIADPTALQPITPFEWEELLILSGQKKLSAAYAIELAAKKAKLEDLKVIKFDCPHLFRFYDLDENKWLATRTVVLVDTKKFLVPKSLIEIQTNNSFVKLRIDFKQKLKIMHESYNTIIS